jgi:predicted amidohydrolase YtcJ
MKLVLDKQPQQTLQQDVATLIRAQERLVDAGVCLVSDSWIDPGMAEVYFAAEEQQRLLIPSELWVRVSPADASAQLDYLASMLAKHHAAGAPENVQISGIKVFLDGVLGSRTATLLGRYRDGSAGDPIWSDDVLDALLKRVAAISRRLRPHFHAVGDAAVRQALDAIERARFANLWTGDAKPVIAHAELVAEADYKRFDQLEVEVVISPQWIVPESSKSPLAGVLDLDTIARVGDFTGMLLGGAHLCYGSDWPVSSPEPLIAIAAVIEHLTKSGFSLEQAIACAWSIVSNQPAATSGPVTPKRLLRFDENPLKAADESSISLANLVHRFAGSIERRLPVTYHACHGRDGHCGGVFEGCKCSHTGSGAIDHNHPVGLGRQGNGYR